LLFKVTESSFEKRQEDCYGFLWRRDNEERRTKQEMAEYE